MTEFTINDIAAGVTQEMTPDAEAGSELYAFRALLSWNQGLLRIPTIPQRRTQRKMKRRRQKRVAQSVQTRSGRTEGTGEGARAQAKGQALAQANILQSQAQASPNREQWAARVALAEWTPTRKWSAGKGSELVTLPVCGKQEHEPRHGRRTLRRP